MSRERSKLKSAVEAHLLEPNSLIQEEAVFWLRSRLLSSRPSIPV